MAHPPILDRSLVARATLTLVVIGMLLVGALLFGAGSSSAEEPENLNDVQVIDLLATPNGTPIDSVTWTWNVDHPELVSGYEIVLGDFETTKPQRLIDIEADVEAHIPTPDDPLRVVSNELNSYYVGPDNRRFTLPLPKQGQWCLAVRAVNQTNVKISASTNASEWVQQRQEECFDPGASEVLIEPAQPRFTKAMLGDPLLAKPIVVEAEHFRSYFDTDRAYGFINTTNVDIYEDFNSPSWGRLVGRTADGEWLTYEVDLAGTYDVAVVVARRDLTPTQESDAGTISVSHNNSVLGAPYDPIQTIDSAFTWERKIVAAGVDFATLPDGQRHTIRVDFSGGSINFDRLEFIPTGATPNNVVNVTPSGCVDGQPTLCNPDLQGLINRNPAGTTYSIAGDETYQHVHGVYPKNKDRFIGTTVNGKPPLFDGGRYINRSAFTTFNALVDAIESYRNAATDVVIENISFRNYAPGGEQGTDFRGVIHGQNYEPFELSDPLTTGWPRKGTDDQDPVLRQQYQSDWEVARGYGWPLNWSISDVTIENTLGHGVYLGSGFHLKDVNIRQSSGLGVGGAGTLGVTIERGEVSENSYAFREARVGDSVNNGLWGHSGGMKITRSKDLLIKDVHIHDNQGPGIWMDIAMQSVDIVNNRIHDNLTVGIFYEISFGNTTDPNRTATTIKANQLARNASIRTNANGPAHAGIYSSTSADVDILDNTVGGSPTGILVYDNRAGRAAAIHEIPSWLLPSDIEQATDRYIGERNNVWDNNVCDSVQNGVFQGGDGAPQLLDGEQGTLASATYERNTYYNSKSEPSFWSGLGKVGLSAWQGLVQTTDETTSTTACPWNQQPPTPTPVPSYSCSVNGGVVSWSDVGSSKYWIYRTPNDRADGWLATVKTSDGSAASTTYTDGSRVSGVSYDYLVHFPDVWPRVPCEDVTPAPSYSCSVNGGVVSWADAGLSKYWIYRTPNDRADGWLAVVKTDDGSPAATTYTDTNRVGGVSYEYEVHYPGVWPRVACDDVTPPPSAFACEVRAGVVTWNDRGADRYWVYRSTSGRDATNQDQFLGRVLGSEPLTLTDSNPVVGATYLVNFQGDAAQCTIVSEP